jgi:carbonic anhydrase
MQQIKERFRRLGALTVGADVGGEFGEFQAQAALWLRCRSLIVHDVSPIPRSRPEASRVQPAKARSRQRPFGRKSMDNLIAGYRRFRAGTWRSERARFEQLSQHGQNPRALVIACSDSRTDPQMVFNAAAGELFVIRNVANLVPPYRPDAEQHGTSAAIEFAVRALKVRDIVVMGHAMCGGIKALLDGTQAELSDFVASWVRLAEPARQKAMQVPAEQRHDFCEHESVRLSLINLMTFPWIKNEIDVGWLTLHGCFFGIRSGVLERLGADGVFHPIPD